MATVAARPGKSRDESRRPELRELPATPPGGGAVRVFIFYSGAVLLTGLVSLLFADLLWRSGWSTSRTILLLLFVLLFFFAAIGCLNALYGFVLRRIGDTYRITTLTDYKKQSIETSGTAIIVPIYNEQV